MFAEGDTAGGLALARAAADTEEVTDKHPVTPAELLPARELEADMMFEAKRYKRRDRRTRRPYSGSGDGHRACSVQPGQRS
jgi:hypothetical protein